MKTDLYVKIGIGGRHAQKDKGTDLIHGIHEPGA